MASPKSRLDRSNPYTPHGGIGSGAAENRRPSASGEPTPPNPAAPPQLDESRQELMDAITVSNELPRPEGLESAPDIALAQWLADLNELEVNGLVLQLEEERRTRMSEEVAASMGMSRDNPMYDATMDISRQRRIEEQVDPIDMMALFMGRPVRQRVPYNDQVEITIQTVPVQHVEWLHRMASDLLANPTRGYFQEWFSRRRVCLAVYAINGEPYSHSVDAFTSEEHYDKFKAAVQARAQEFGRIPEQLFEEFRAHAIWFDVRVRKCLAGNPARKLGN